MDDARKGSEMNLGFPLYQGVTLADFAGATQVLSFAEGLRPFWVAQHTGPILTTEGVAVLPNYSFNYCPRIDVLFVPGGGPGGVIWAMCDMCYRDFVKRAGLLAKWIGSVCTGAFPVAAANLFRDVEVTTYWNQIDNLTLLGNKQV